MGGGHLLPGSTVANLTALWAARELVGVREVVASAAAHLSVRKAANIPGAGLPGGTDRRTPAASPRLPGRAVGCGARPDGGYGRHRRGRSPRRWPQGSLASRRRGVGGRFASARAMRSVWPECRPPTALRCRVTSGSTNSRNRRPSSFATLNAPTVLQGAVAGHRPMTTEGPLRAVPTQRR